jgi:hypothetical protein
MNFRWPQGEGRDGLPRLRVDRRTARPQHLHADAPSSRRGTANAGALNMTKVKTAAAAVDSVSATGNDPPTPGTARARPHPMTSQNQDRRTGSQW